ncbi:hemerythrin [Roseburia sp. OF03-24]|jgi:hemerythrin|uniref:bacteriohemerythrin n=1 Tax=Roseburia sp. OF03-24 TaxID=2292367 RepID=UPI000E553DDD|nr:bacteriohemerythrin [Roseburia sp. OF03-24]RGX94712.1 hemerythrin [Roseburia sp. OF03-24]
MYKFTDDCLIGIEEIDNEHRRLFHMINEAIDLSKENMDVSAITKNLLPGLKDYAATHFAHEEAYMERIHDPELPIQKKEHEDFTKTVNSFSLDTSSPEATKKSFDELLTYLVRWLYRHILSSDIMIGKMSSISANEEDPFAFTEKYHTGIDLVDNEHRRLFEIIHDTNDLIHAELLHDKYDEIMRLLAELKDYTEIHFHDEEALMERIQYPELDAQKRAHTAFVERLVEIDLTELDDMDDNQQEYLIDLIQFLAGWLINHILGSDKKIGEYMREHGIKEE